MVEEAEPLHRAILSPSEWHVLCPVCGGGIDIHEVYEDAAGAFCASGPDRFLHCDDCDAFIEVVPASVQEAYPASALRARAAEASDG